MIVPISKPLLRTVVFAAALIALLVGTHGGAPRLRVLGIVRDFRDHRDGLGAWPV